MELKKVKEMLEKYDIEAEEVTVNKNGIPEKGLIVGHEAIRPIIYEYTVKDLKEMEVLHLVNDALLNPMISEADISKIMNKDFILDNVYCAIRHRTEDDSIFKIDFKDDLEKYYYIRVNTKDENGYGSIKVTGDILKRAEILPTDLIYRAEQNTRKEVRIISMFEALSELTGDELGQMDMPQMYVATNEKKVNGAVAMIFDDLLDEFCYEHGFKDIIIIPSSTHEVLLLPANDELSCNNLCNLISTVNATEVNEHEQLSDHPYYYSASPRLEED